MKTYKQVFEALEWASSYLQQRQLEDSAARLIMQHVLATSYSSVMLKMYDELTTEQAQQFSALVKEYGTGRPVQYCIGSEEFYGRNFKVDESVLIPRPETEELVVGVLQAVDKLFGNAPCKLVDIGTGSGIIATTIKLERPQTMVSATDLSAQALATAKINAEQNGAQITFFLGDLTAPIAQEKWDVIVSNPPYIAFAEAEEMSDVVLAHEPHSALFAEDNGLALYKRLATEAKDILQTPGLLAVEIGYLQGEAVAQFFAEAFPQAQITVQQDINGKDRMVFCIVDK